MKVKKLLVAALMLVAAVSYGQTYSPNVITTGVSSPSIPIQEVVQWVIVV